MANNDGWITSPFTREQLDGKKVYFALPPQNEKFFGHLHVEENSMGQLRITIDYGGPDSSGKIQSGLWTIDQPIADQLRALDFIIPPN